MLMRAAQWRAKNNGRGMCGCVGGGSGSDLGGGGG